MLINVNQAPLFQVVFKVTDTLTTNLAQIASVCDSDHVVGYMESDPVAYDRSGWKKSAVDFLNGDSGPRMKTGPR